MIHKKPLLMVAPNGARRGKKDHPNLPLTIAEIAQTAAECAAAGADAIHAHARDAQGRHSLDAGLCRELLAALAAAAPDMAVQITTESAGRYRPADQRRLLYDLQPAWASVALREMLSDNDLPAAKRLYHQAAESGTRIQHIVYCPAEVHQLARYIADGVIPAGSDEMLFVLGRYDGSAAAALPDFLEARQARLPAAKFMACAFKEETACLLAAAAAGGDCRVGFENNLHHPGGEIAAGNAERVTEVIAALAQAGLR